jgi:hypothetical protein
MNTNEIDKIDRCRNLLPEPAPQVVGQLLEEIRAMRESFAVVTDQLVQAQIEIRRLRDIEP